jgi:hypothetical protein
MSDYYGSATLEDWLSEEVFDGHPVTPEVVVLFERWRSGVQASIESWMDSDDGEGRRSWRGWGRGFNAIPDADDVDFDVAVDEGKRLMNIQ